MMIKDGVLYRTATWDDLEGLVALDSSKWNDEIAAGADKWISRLNIFPEGIKVAEDMGKIAGVSCSHIVDYPIEGYPTWEAITDNGYIRNHNPNGNKVYGVNFAVNSDKPHVAYNLQECVLNEVARPRNLPWRVGYTAPFVSKYKKEMGKDKLTRDEVFELASKDAIVNNLFFRQGFKLIDVSENYFEIDKLSDGWGVILEAD